MSGVQRRFRGPSGRAWTATLYDYPEPEGAGPGNGSHRPKTVLRFSSDDDVMLELAEWPRDWLELGDDQLVQLARRANPPRI